MITGAEGEEGEGLDGSMAFHKSGESWAGRIRECAAEESLSRYGPGDSESMPSSSAVVGRDYLRAMRSIC
jgi:hypothetical protein